MPIDEFTRKMQKATREVHALSDALINAKLSFALSDNDVWAEGLLVFYEIFRYLEEAVDRLPNTYVSDLFPEEMKRTKAFEEDLNFYLSSDWHKEYTPRECVSKYLLHLQHLEQTEPELLMAYIYHLHMGLLTGAQILKKKRQLLGSVFAAACKRGGGYAITEYRRTTIYQIKRELRAKMNSIAEVLDDDLKAKLIEESKNVFILNNDLIRSVKGTYQALLKKFGTSIIIFMIVFIVCFAFVKYW